MQAVPQKLVTLYGPRGEVVVQPTMLDIARTIDPPMQLTGVVEALNRHNSRSVLPGDVVYLPSTPTGLFDQHGKRIYR